MSWRSFFLDLLFPVECLGCSQESTWLCPDCFKKLKFGNGNQATNLTVPFLDRVFIAGDYDDPLLADLIKKLKYNFLTALSEPLGRFLILFWQGQIALNSGENLKNNWREARIIPIPLSKARRRSRGFNQAELLARQLSNFFSYPLDLNLKRLKHSRPQASLNEAERATNILNSFGWTGGDLNGQTIILLDDVVTTGATLNEAARVLRAAGAARIYGLVLAKG